MYAASSAVSRRAALAVCTRAPRGGIPLLRLAGTTNTSNSAAAASQHVSRQLCRQLTASAARRSQNAPLAERFEAMFPRVRKELRLLFSGDAPRGFGKFFPKNGKSGGSSGKAGEQGAKQGTKQGSGSAKEAGEETLKSKSSSSSKKGSQKGAPSGGPKPPDQDTVQKLVGGSILLTILAFMLLSEGGNWGSEINWHDFQTDLLESGQVERIVVINNK
eukprot:19447-Heterococcus_DN1.PRE.1